MDERSRLQKRIKKNEAEKAKPLELQLQSHSPDPQIFFKFCQTLLTLDSVVITASSEMFTSWTPIHTSSSVPGIETRDLTCILSLFHSFLVDG